MIETTRRSFLGGLIGLIAAPAIITEAAVRPGLWTPPKVIEVNWPVGGWIGRINDLGKLTMWRPLGSESWLPMDTHVEAEHWKRILFPSGYRNTEQELSPPWLVHKWVAR